MQVIVNHLTCVLRSEFCPSARLYSFVTIDLSLLSPKPSTLLLILKFSFSIYHYFEEYCQVKCREPKRTKRRQNRLWSCVNSSICDAITHSSPSGKKYCEELRPPHWPWSIRGIASSILTIRNHVLRFFPVLKPHETASVVRVVVKWAKKSSHLTLGMWTLFAFWQTDCHFPTCKMKHSN